MTEQIPGYPVDLVLCIDGTSSMTPIIEEVKSRALAFYSDLQREMETKERSIDQLRLRVVVFRDLGVDGAGALEASDFFALPDQDDAFSHYVSSIKAYGGGDEPESGLEALAVAIRSPWSKSGVKRRQIIVVWTDASAHRLGEGDTSGIGSLQSDIPRDFDTLTDTWQGQESPMDLNAQRLILYAPDAYPWTDISNHWERSIHHPSRGGAGLSDVDYKTILSAIAESV